MPSTLLLPGQRAASADRACDCCGASCHVCQVRSNRAVIDLALRRLVASKQKSARIDGILELGDFPEELGSPVISYPEPDK